MANKTKTIPFGNCTEDEVVDFIFGSVSEFARQVEINGDEFEYEDYIITYDAEKDIHTFWI